MKREKESKVFTELRRVRDEMLAEEKRVGSDKYWAEVNRQGKEFAHRHGMKIVELPVATAVRERSDKYKTKAR